MRIRIPFYAVSSALALFVMTGLLLPSCRKGEDDPLLSLRTRKERLKGTWNLKRCIVRGSYTPADSVYFDFIITAEDDTYHLDFIGDTIEELYTGPIDLSLIFDKEGGVKISESMYLVPYKASGMWDFLRGTGKAKNKERLCITMDKVTEGSSGSFHFFMTARTSVVFYVKELRSNQLVLVEEGAGNFDDAGPALRVEAEYVFRR